MANKKQQIAAEIAKVVGAGKPVALETVDFNDPNRPKTCLEVDFPILPVNQVASIEGNAGKPIYQMSKWWARRRSSVFRSMLIAAAAKAPDDPAHAAKHVWDHYYANHQKKGAFKNLKVADIFMGGGTTLVEGSRLGMQMFGNDLNPVAWFVVKQEFAKVDLEEVQRLLADIEAEVKPQIMPFYYCDGPNGEKGKWTHVPSGRVEGPEFDPLSLTPEQRRDYSYEGPEIIYTFWAKHGPCQVTGCGHRTPIMTSPVMAVKTLSVKHWPVTCKTCSAEFDVEEKAARMAPDVPLYVAPTERPYTILDRKRGVVCPQCGDAAMVKLDKGKNKKVELSLLVHPQWLTGSPQVDESGRPYGGSAQDDATSTALWNDARASNIRLLEVRGALPETVTCPQTGGAFASGKEGGSVPKAANFTCAACGTVQPIVKAIQATKKTAPAAIYAIQGYSAKLEKSGNTYGGRFYSAFSEADSINAATLEWETRKETDLREYWPRSPIPFGHMTHQRQPLPQHGYTHWWEMYNPRQLLLLSQILKAIVEAGGGGHAWSTREYVLGAFQQYVKNQCMFSFWHLAKDHYAPALSNNNFHPKANIVEVGAFCPVGYGPWNSATQPILEGQDWLENPWELVSAEHLFAKGKEFRDTINSKSEKVYPGDKPIPATIRQGTATDLADASDSEYDLIITDPPFGGLLHYSELSEFFYVWLRPALKNAYKEQFGLESVPKSLEVIANRAREPDPDAFYQRLLTQSWREARRVLKNGGILAFTFHHSEDEPWVAVLESLFDAGFYLEATYPIRSDETKGDGEFGSKTIEYDIIHVCRKCMEEPQPVSWGRMRREVLADVRQLQGLLENHAKEGLPAADLQVIRRGKALEYFSRHYGKVFKADGEPISVKEALVGINQILDEDANGVQDPPPVNAEPITRQFLRIFDKTNQVARDQMQKFLRGSGIAPDEFEQREWCAEKNKVFTLADPLAFARDWQGKHRRKLTVDLDQALVLIGACYEGSGINASDTLRNDNFKDHPALKDLLSWLCKHGADQHTRNAASRALTIFNSWAATKKDREKQMAFFFDEEAA